MITLLTWLILGFGATLQNSCAEPPTASPNESPIIRSEFSPMDASGGLSERIIDELGLNERQRDKLWSDIRGYTNSLRQSLDTINSFLLESGLEVSPRSYGFDSLSTDTLSISIGFGYKNGDLSIVQDGILYELLQRQLLKECEPASLSSSQIYVHICGFQATTPSGLFLKEIQLISGRTKIIKLQIFSSSYSVSDYMNRTRFQTEQEQQSMNAFTQFMQSLESADVVFYVGHSRGGGGPDFYPPRLKSGFENQPMVEGDRVDYTSYKKDPDGLEQMILALGANSHHPRVLGVFSCDSAGHFETALNAVLISDTPTPATQLILTYPAPGTKVNTTSFEALLVSLNGVLTEQAPVQLNQILQKFQTKMNPAE